MTDNLLHPPEVARLLGIKSQTLSVWRMKGVGPSYSRISRRLVLYKESDVMAFLAARTFTSTSEETVKAGSRPTTTSAEPATSTNPRR